MRNLTKEHPRPGSNPVWCFLSYLFISAACVACVPQVHQVGRDFYYWKTVFAISDRDTRLMKGLGTQTLYIRYFDLSSRKGKAVLVSPVIFKDIPDVSFKVVPVVFITREVLNSVLTEQCNSLASNIISSVYSISRHSSIHGIREIQIDCDWTSASKAAYFQLLETIKKAVRQRDPELEITATIRLHQVKYFVSSGIPPVDRGVLMAYNMDTPVLFNDGNSVFSYPEVMDYLKNADRYPLDLTVALPLFSWAAHFSMGGKFLGLMNGISRLDIRSTRAFRRIGRFGYLAMKDCKLGEVDILKGDLLKLSEPGLPELKKFTRQLQYRRKFSGHRIILFYFDEKLIGRYLRNGILQF